METLNSVRRNATLPFFVLAFPKPVLIATTSVTKITTGHKSDYQFYATFILSDYELPSTFEGNVKILSPFKCESTYVVVT